MKPTNPEVPMVQYFREQLDDPFLWHCCCIPTMENIRRHGKEPPLITPHLYVCVCRSSLLITPHPGPDDLILGY